MRSRSPCVGTRGGGEGLLAGRHAEGGLLPEEEGLGRALCRLTL